MVENHFEWFLTDRFGKLYYFDKSKIILGRKDCDIHLKSISVDYKHCILSINEKDKSLKIKDLETSNGTFINDKQIKPNNFKNLNVGDKIRLAYDQITFTVQKKSVGNVNITNSPSRGTELPSVVTDPERCMTPVVCEMTDSQSDIGKSVEKIIEKNEKIDEKQEYSKTIEKKKIQLQEIQQNLKPEISIVKEFINVEVKEDLNIAQSKPAESFTIDFTNSEINDGESLSSVGLSRFVPGKLRSSFEGREKVNRTKLQYSNSLNKPSDSPRFGKNENKILPVKATKVNNFNKSKLDSKPSETIAKPKISNFSKKIPEKNVKTKSESSSKVLQKQLKTPNDSNNNKDKNKSVKNTIINSKNVTPTLSKRNSKSYLLEKMLMGDESNVNFENFDEFNKEEEKVTEIVLPIINNENYVPPVIDDVKVSIETNQELNDAVSEAGTYIIENEANEKTVDTEDTLEKDDASTISSTHFNTQELESKSSTKWLSEFPTDDVIMENEGKSKRNTNTKFTGCSMPHIPSNIPMENEKNYRDEDSAKINNSILVNDIRTRNSRVPPYNAGDPNNNLNSEELNSWAVNDSDSNKKASNSKINSQSYQQVPISPYVMGNQSLLVAEDVYVSDVMTNSTVPTNNYSRNSNLPQKSKEMDLFSLNFSSTQPNSNYHPRSTYSVASLDTALLLQDTEALLNDMEKRVYSRREIKTEEFTRIQPFSTSFPQSEKIPYVDDGEEREEDTSLFNYSADVDESVRLSNLKQQTSLSNHNESMSTEDKNRSYTVRSPISSGIIRRNNSCKVGVSESIVTQSNIAARKLNSTIRNQRSCSLIEERKLNHNNNNNNNNNNSNNNIETFADYRNKPKLSLLAMNSGTFVNRRGSGGYSSALNSPIGKFEPISAFNSSFPIQKSKEPMPYNSNNMLSVHRQKFNRYEYGQHSLKYNSNSTTMLYNKYNSTSPPWNMDDINNINQNSVYPNYDTDYLYNTMPEPFEASMLFLKHEPNIIENMNQHQTHFDSNTDSDFPRRDDIVEFSQTGNISGRSSAFSPVNSLHQSTESVNNFQITNKSRSSLGLNEQRLYNYDFLLVSSIHLYSARLCRYTEEIVHRLRREDPEYKGSSPIDSALEQSDSFGQLKSANRELQETLNNMRSLEKQLQKIEKSVFPPEKSGRNSTLGSCTEDSYLNQLERINKELEDFVPIDDEENSRNSTSAKPSTRQEYSYLKTKDTKPANQTSITKSQQTVEKSKSKSRADTKLDQTKNSFSSSDICSPTKSKYSSLSKRFQHRKD